MKYIWHVIITTLLLTQNYKLVAQQDTNYAIIELEWNDFKISNTLNNNYTAKVAVNHKCEISYQLNTKEVSIILNSAVKLDKLNSKVDKTFLKKANNEEKIKLLEHEKGHILISILYQYKLMEAFETYKFSNNYKEEVRNLVGKITQEKEEMNQLYDLETDHHRNQEAQKKWDEELWSAINKYIKNNTIEWSFEKKRIITL